MKKYIPFLYLCFSFIINVEAMTRNDFLKEVVIKIDNVETTKLTDDNHNTYEKINSNNSINITTYKNITGIYIIYSGESKTGNINYKRESSQIGKDGYLHEFIKIQNSNEINITYNDEVIIKEIYTFDSIIPNWVQRWEPPCEDADFMLLVSHGDDEHIFFAGLIPTMINNNKRVQIVYGTKPENELHRLNEILNGLWVAGVKNYPVIGIIPDKYSTTLNKAINNLSKSGLNEDKVINYTVNLIRKFKPEVIVTHDENGEYGHGQHQLLSHITKESLKYVNDDTYESPYVPFEPYKVYMHLYKENTIVMDYDKPLKYFDGLTAFRVSMNALKEHTSQMITKWGKWTTLESVTEIKDHNPAYFGLYYSSVGYENVDNDMFYNVPLKIEEPVIENSEDKNIVNEIEEKTTNKFSKKYIAIIVIINVIILTFVFILITLIKH